MSGSIFIPGKVQQFFFQLQRGNGRLVSFPQLVWLQVKAWMMIWFLQFLLRTILASVLVSFSLTFCRLQHGDFFGDQSRPPPSGASCCTSCPSVSRNWLGQIRWSPEMAIVTHSLQSHALFKPHEKSKHGIIMAGLITFSTSFDSFQLLWQFWQPLLNKANNINNPADFVNTYIQSQRQSKHVLKN